jgi:hypothetical protein
MLAALILAAQAPATSPPDLNAYVQCVGAAAARLAASAEPAETVAKVAVFECQSKLAAAARAVDEASRSQLKARGWAGDGKLHTYDELEPGLKADAEQAALSIIVENRLSAAK